MRKLDRQGRPRASIRKTDCVRHSHYVFDACSNMFDAMESVAKEKYQMPNSTFGQVVARIPGTKTVNTQIVGVLGALNDLRNKNFGHGMTAPFQLSTAEVDFTYLACIGGILFLTRLP